MSSFVIASLGMFPLSCLTFVWGFDGCEWGPPRAACEPIGTGLWRATGNSSGGDGAQLEIWKGRQQTEKPKKTQRPCREASYARKGRHASAGPEEKGLEWAVKEKASTVSGASEAS